jgi:truncated hemoglobin YjbI/ankyrin repeat protein
MGVAMPTSLDHRGLLSHPPDFHPFRGSGLYERIGGQPTINRLVDLLYQAFEDDEQLRPLFPHDLDAGRWMQKLFFAEWLDGPRRYSERASSGLVHRHDGLPITPELADRWLDHFRHAMEATIAVDEDRDTIFAHVQPLAMALVSGQVAAARPKGRRGKKAGESTNGPRRVAWCGVEARILTRSQDFARRGDAAGLDTMLAEAPDLLLSTYASAIMQTAVLAGRAEIVGMLLEHGVGVDHPYRLPVSLTGLAFERVLFVTPLCAARMKRRPAVESLLIEAGAHEDVFTSAYLGDIPSLTRMLADDPNLAAATDPAVDVLDITPVEHAVASGQPAALRIVLDHVTHPLPSGTRALRDAAARGSVEMVELLLENGADATRIGVGRWVLHSEIAPLLARRGAAIDSSGSWIGATCTGNQGRKDDPDYVRALLRHGARATDRRFGAPQGATALHYAAKAGFLRTIAVLIEHGADPRAQDNQGRTPLDWLAQAAPSVSRDAVRDVLIR